MVETSEQFHNSAEEEDIVDEKEMVNKFCNEWVESLDQDNRVSLGLFIHFQLMQYFSFTMMNAAKYAGLLVDRSERTIREWRKAFFDNNGEISESKQGRYQRTGILWSNEELNHKVCEYVRQKCCVKGQPNMRLRDFCSWVNDVLLPNSTLEPGFPHHVSTETAHKWLHHVGYEYLSPKKGSFVDGHERSDVVDHRKKFLRKMVGLGFLRKEHAETLEAKQSFPEDLEEPPKEVTEKTIVFFMMKPFFKPMKMKNDSGG